MADKNHIQIVAVLPGGGFESLGLVALDNLGAVMGPLSTLDTRGGHHVSPIDIKRAYDRAVQRQEARNAGGNDGDDDGA